MKATDSVWMERAITLARKGKGRTSPNPAVGAVIVKKGAIIGEGWHKKAGAPHAEAAALKSCKTSPQGATIYVTLEPCNHHGRTPPCAEAIIESGIREVVIGAKDRSPKKGRKGIEALRRAGVKVRTAVMEAECERLIEDFNKHSTTALPFFTLKAALTLDGKIATRTGDSKWISSPQSRRLVHQLRNESDAIIVGVDTVIADDPLLTVRHGQPRKNPLRVIVDSQLKIPAKSKIVKTANGVPTLVVTTHTAPAMKVKTLGKAGVEVVTLPAKVGRVNLRKLAELLGERNVMGAMVESGGRLASAFLDAGLIDRALFHIAPKLVGGDYCALNGAGVAKMAEAWPLTNIEISNCGGDIVVEGVL